MSKLILRLLALSAFTSLGAFGQIGSFGQIAFGGGWQTTFTLINLNSTSPVTLTLSFFGDTGFPLNAPVQGSGNTSAYTFTILAGGAQNVVLASSNPFDSTAQGWASLSMTSASGGPVRGQGSFRFLLPGGAISEAVVPLTLSVDSTSVASTGSGSCIIPFPTGPGCIISLPTGTSTSTSTTGSGSCTITNTSTSPVILIPFDNTTGQYLTSLAFANITGSAQNIPIEFDDQSGNLLLTDAVPLSARQHKAFVITTLYPRLSGQKGILRIHADPATLTVLGLLSNATSAITTILPITQ